MGVTIYVVSVMAVMVAVTYACYKTIGQMGDMSNWKGVERDTTHTQEKVDKLVIELLEIQASPDQTTDLAPLIKTLMAYGDSLEKK